MGCFCTIACNIVLIVTCFVLKIISCLIVLYDFKTSFRIYVFIYQIVTIIKNTHLQADNTILLISKQEEIIKLFLKIFKRQGNYFIILTIHYLFENDYNHLYRNVFEGTFPGEQCCQYFGNKLSFFWLYVNHFAMISIFLL